MDVAIAAALFLLAASVRLGVLSVAQIGPDCVGPYLGAYEMLTTGDWLGPSYFPESGPALYWLQVPFLLGADGLEVALRRRFLLQAFWTPFLYLGLRVAFAGLWGASPRATPIRRDGARRLAPLLGACALGFSQGPLLSLLSGAEGFVAPDLAAVMTVAVALVVLANRDRWLLAAWAMLPLAMMVHGMSASYGPGLLLLAVIIWLRGRRWLAAGAVLLGAVGFAPRAVQLVQSVIEEGFGGAMQAARYNSEGDQFWTEVISRTVDHFTVRDPLPWGPLLAAAPLLLVVVLAVAPRLAPTAFTRAMRRSCWLFAIWLGCTVGGLLLVASSIRYLQGYHWRILYPAAAAALALAAEVSLRAWTVWRRTESSPTVRRPRLRSFVLVSLATALLLGAAGLAKSRWPTRPMATSDLGVTARFASAIVEASGPARRWHDTAAVGLDPWGYAPAIYLNERLAGHPGSYGLDGTLYLLFSADRPVIEEIDADNGWTGQPAPAASTRFPGATLVARAHPWNGPQVLLLHFDGPEASRRWSGRVLEQAGDQPVRMRAEAGEYLPAITGTADYATIDAWFAPGLVR